MQTKWYMDAINNSMPVLTSARMEEFSMNKDDWVLSLSREIVGDCDENIGVLLIDFNYTHEPVAGTFPFPGVGPLKLLQESRMNHYGKLAFRWIYWNMLLPGRHIPFVSATMNKRGKNLEKSEVTYE